MVKSILFFFLAITLCWAEAKIVRPCKLSDYKCIGANLAANSNCNKNVKGYLPNEYPVNRFRFEAPSFNSSYVERDIIVRNFNKCFISEFFFNLDSKKAVLGIDCPRFDIDTDRELIRHQSLKEDTYYNYHIRAVYPLIRLTVNLPSTTHMDLCRANVFTDVTTLPKFHIDPKDNSTANFLTKDLSMLNIFERESFFYYGYALSRIYVDEVLCDYDRATANYLTRDLTQLNIFERESCYYRGFPIARIFIDTYICNYNCYPFILD